MDGHTDRRTESRKEDKRTERRKVYTPRHTSYAGGIMRLDISCESSARQKIHMKHQALFSSKDKRK